MWVSDRLLLPLLFPSFSPSSTSLRYAGARCVWAMSKIVDASPSVLSGSLIAVAAAFSCFPYPFHLPLSASLLPRPSNSHNSSCLSPGNCSHREQFKKRAAPEACRMQANFVTSKLIWHGCSSCSDCSCCPRLPLCPCSLSSCSRFCWLQTRFCCTPYSQLRMLPTLLLILLLLPLILQLRLTPRFRCWLIITGVKVVNNNG